MKHFFYIIAIISLLATLNSCTADEIETENPKVQVEVQVEVPVEVPVEVQTDVDPNTNGGIIPPKK